ncbi:MAG: GxxExxY protein [Planctomycetota bacterium]|nr:GxxExxY protein [Planctomycetota bacterium]
MPIHCRITIPALTPDEFKTRDYRIMGQAFACQNELGRFCEEGAYEADLVARLRADWSCEVYAQEPVVVTYEDFSKTYFLDLIVDGALYELKAVSSLSGEHKSQLLNYMLLLGLRCGKLLNFRPDKVQGQLVVTGLTRELRRQLTVDTTQWQELSAACGMLRKTLTALLADWGAFLEVSLYQEALTHFLGGPERVIQRVPLVRDELSLGTQRMHVHATGIGFVVTAFTTDQAAHGANLRKLLALTPLTAIQWLNLDHANIQFITLTR